MNKPQLSQRMFFMMFVLATFSPSIMLLPSIMSKSSSYLAVAASLAWMAAIVLLLAYIMRAEGECFQDKLASIVGRVLARMITAVLLAWCVLLIAIYSRYFAERVLSTFIGDSSALFVMAAMLATVGIVLVGGFRPYARLNELLLYLFLLIFVITSVFGLIANCSLDNLAFEIEDSVPTLALAWAPIGVWSMLLFLLFCADKANNVFGRFVKGGLITSAVVAIAACLMLVVAIGAFGEQGVQLVSLPYFLAVKHIDFLAPFEKLGAAVFSMWLIADFACLAMLTSSATAMFAKLTTLDRPEPTTWGVLVIAYLVGFFAFDSNLTLERILHSHVLPISALVFTAIPIVLALVKLVRGWLTSGKS